MNCLVKTGMKHECRENPIFESKKPIARFVCTIFRVHLFIYLGRFWGFKTILAPLCIFKLKMLSFLGIFLPFFDF